MRRTLPAVVFLLATVTVAYAAEPEAVKVIARGPWPHLPTHTSAGIGTDRAPITRVMRSETELAKAAGANGGAAVAKALGVDAVDFDKQMLVAVEDGTQPMVGTSGGGPPSALYAVSVAHVVRDDATKTMTVHWQLVPRGKEQGGLTRPLAVAMVERSDYEVKFNKLPPADKPGEKPTVDGKELAAVARASWPDGWKPEAPRVEWVVRGSAALIDPRLESPEPVLERMRVDAAARYAKALGVKEIDFATQMVVGVSGGVRPSGTSVEVTKVDRDAAAKTLTVYWRVNPPKKNPPGGGIEHVAEVVLIDRSDDTVRFKEDTAKRE